MIALLVRLLGPNAWKCFMLACLAIVVVIGVIAAIASAGSPR
jgi:hypothetical protein